MSKLTDYIQEKILGPRISSLKDEKLALHRENNRLKNKIEEKNFDLVTQLGASFGITGTSNKDIMQVYISWLYTNMTAIAEAVANIQIELFQVSNNGDIKDVPAHPALELISRVNDHMTKWELIYLWTIHMLWQGEAAWYMTGRTNERSEPREIWPLRPDYLKIIPGDLSNNEFIKKYEYRVPGKKVVEFMPWEILFFKVPHPTNIYRGYGVFEAVMRDVNIDIAASEFNEVFLANFGRIEGVLSTEQRLSDETIKRLQQDWNAKYSGPKNAGKTAVLEQGLNYNTIATSPKEMDFIEGQKWTRDKIMAMFRNSKVILGITEDVNRANAEASEMVWTKHNIKPKMQRLIDQLNEFFLPIYQQNLFFGFVDPVPETVELKLSEYTQGVDKWITRNEIREREGLDPVEGGDALYLEFTKTPLENAGEEKPSSEPAVTEDDMMDDEDMDEPKKVLTMPVIKGKVDKLRVRYAKEIQAVKQRMYREKALIEQVSKVLSKVHHVSPTATKATAKPAEKKQIKAFNGDGLMTEEMKQHRWEVMDKFAKTYEARTEVVVIGTLNKLRDTILERLQAPEKAVKGVDDFMPPTRDFVKLSINGLIPVLRQLAQDQGDETLEFLGIDNPFQPTKEVIEAIRRFALESSNSYVGTARDKIRSVIAAGLEKGEGPEVIARRVRNEFTGFSRKQAVRLARTETVRAANYATEKAFEQSKVVTGKQWFTALDERTCPWCEALDGKIFDVSETIFDKGTEFQGNAETALKFDYDAIDFPPLHPGCRCTISPVILDQEKRFKLKEKKLEEKLEEVKTELLAEIGKVKNLTDQQLIEIGKAVPKIVDEKVDGLVEELAEKLDV